MKKILIIFFLSLGWTSVFAKNCDDIDVKLVNSTNEQLKINYDIPGGSGSTTISPSPDPQKILPFPSPNNDRESTWMDFTIINSNGQKVYVVGVQKEKCSDEHDGSFSLYGAQQFDPTYKIENRGELPYCVTIDTYGNHGCNPNTGYPGVVFFEIKPAKDGGGKK